MTTRKEYEQAVKGPGKFQGEPPWVPYFWEALLDGDGDLIYENEGLGESVTAFEVEPQDVKMFPELRHTPTVYLHQTSSGFIGAIPASVAKEIEKEYE